MTLSDLAVTYDGSANVATATTDPAGLTVDLTYSQGSTLVAPIAAVAAVAAVDAVAATYEALTFSKFEILKNLGHQKAQTVGKFGIAPNF